MGKKRPAVIVWVKRIIKCLARVDIFHRLTKGFRVIKSPLPPGVAVVRTTEDARGNCDVPR